MIFHDDLKIVWKHVLPCVGEVSGLINEGYTQCTILKNNQEIAHGIAICSENDQFVKETGRKISLQRALVETNFSKEERTAIWQTYLNRK